ncbi:DUF72 domain-containing protein, partial [Kribbella sp. NPDC050820]|uniref:DUF72 domain-containing protein n=1 Tax=Kribbella sp. NPDC050820 TaxID=3155408 RepID=UPI0033E64E8C
MDRWPDGRYRVGISGWRYAPWRKVYYPEGLPQRAELEYASGRLNSIELNGSFYSLQRPSGGGGGGGGAAGGGGVWGGGAGGV